MSIMMSLVGIKEKSGRENTEEWNKMKKLKEDCESIGAEVPNKVFYYFQEHEEEKEIKVPHQEISVDMGEGIEVKVEDIPKEAKIIRFTYQH